MKANKNDLHESGRPLSKEEFIEKIKTDSEFAAKWGELGPIYGKQWRSWGQYSDVCVDNDWGNGNQGGAWVFKQIDQITDAIHKLKTNPDDRGIIVSAWNVGELDQMVLRPCHNFFQFYTRELSLEERVDIFNQKKERDEIIVPEFNSVGDMNAWTNNLLDTIIPTRAISLMYNARSQDVPLGTPFNIASYALLLEIIAKMVNMIPDELISNMGDYHIYLNQVDGLKELLTREPYELPKLVHIKNDDFYKKLSEDLSLLFHLDVSDFVIENYKSHPTIKIPLSN